MKSIILKNYRRQRESDLVTLGHRIVEKMEANSNFPNPPASLATLKQILPEFQAALIEARGREKEKVSVKNDKKAKLIGYFDELARYVTVTCNGDRSLLLNSGFEVSGEKINQTIPFIDKLEVELGPPGEATTRIKKFTGAGAYLHQYCTEPPSSNTVWVTEGSKLRFHTFKGLVSAARYWFRIAVVHASGQTVYSPVIQRIIQ